MKRSKKLKECEGQDKFLKLLFKFLLVHDSRGYLSHSNIWVPKKGCICALRFLKNFSRFWQGVIYVRKIEDEGRKRVKF